jgi:hypothetical protein
MGGAGQLKGGDQVAGGLQSPPHLESGQMCSLLVLHQKMFGDHEKLWYK